ncbi:hypothetical protein HMN09_00403700 [Mycena chlorophos]|uniref:Uncharacterized protein n=1 Tax=Mycena chlorophos TaxID=658473 RepID=A0A8H6THC0_MYCCL|nr:hypothetical protein HMN09_00403700 [Mycena chlorophos]
MSPPRPGWSQLPCELRLEIACHTQDLHTLRSMCLASRAMRESAVEQLFSVVVFSWPEDLSYWHEVLSRTPRLSNTVKTVEFSGLDHTPSRRGKGKSRVPWKKAPFHPSIPPFSRAHTVIWNALSTEEPTEPEVTELMVSYMALFPALRTLELHHICFGAFGPFSRLLSSCSLLKYAVFNCVEVWEPESESEVESDWDEEQIDLHRTRVSERNALLQVASFDLTSLERLRIMGSGEYTDALFERSSPRNLTHLVVRGSPESDEPPQHMQMGTLLGTLATVSRLVHLRIDPSFNLTGSWSLDYDTSPRPLPQTFSFPVLESLTLELRKNQHAQIFLRCIKADNLTMLALQIGLEFGYSSRDEEEHLTDITDHAFPWDPSEEETMRDMLTNQFPALDEVRFQPYADRQSKVHWSRRLRGRMEYKLRRRLNRTRTFIVADFLTVEWLDEHLGPVVYGRNGKPRQYEYDDSRGREPSTDEESDHELEDWEYDEWDEETEGPPPKRKWTEEDERAYRREMLAELDSDDGLDWDL